jgi:hypothetical protein
VNARAFTIPMAAFAGELRNRTGVGGCDGRVSALAVARPAPVRLAVAQRHQRAFECIDAVRLPGAMTFDVEGLQFECVGLQDPEFLRALDAARKKNAALDPMFGLIATRHGRRARGRAGACL